MCARKLKYAAGDDLMLYATPKESLEASKKESEEKERWKRVAEEQERLKRLADEQQWLQRGQQPGYQNDRIRFDKPYMNTNNNNNSNSRIVSAPPAMSPQYNNNSSINMRPHSTGIISPTQKKNRPPPVPVRKDGYVPNNRSHSSSPVKRSSPGVSSHSSPVAKESLAQRDINVAKQLFHNHDIKKRNRLTGEELQNLLQNDDNSRFCISSIDSIIDFFGQARFGTVNEMEFISLYQKIKYWRKIYVDNDINHSLTINLNEYHNCLQELKYLIPLEISERLFDQFAEFNINTNVNNKELKFDKFVESLIWLMKLTKMFRKFDLNHEGVANIAYKDFIDTTLYLGRFLPH